MTAIQFIEKLVSQNTTLKAEQAYKIYLENLNGEEASTYPYFRTKYNNHLRFNIGATNTNSQESTIEINISEEAVAETFDFTLPEVITEPELLRSVKNYKDGSSELPTPPDLIPTGVLFDSIISDRITTKEEMEEHSNKYGEDFPEDKIEIGGFTRKCVDIVAGKAGSGKTYSRCVLAAKAKVFMKREYGVDIRVGFISGEMRESEWAKELAKCELLKELEVDYMLNYVGQNNYEDIFWEALADYDIVVVDSFPAILGHIRMSPNEKRNERIIINDFIRKILKLVEERNNNVQLINQCNKDGSYKGGTELPHMLSSLSYIVTEGSSRYLIYEKNRNNGATIGQKVYFTKTTNGDIEFNEEAYNATYKTTEDKKQSLEELFSSLNGATLEAELQDLATEDPTLNTEALESLGEFEGGGNGYLVDRNALTQD
jgi:hypothetical protein